MKYEPIIRLSAFALVLCSLLLLEYLWPRRKLSLPRRERWTANFGVLAFNTALVRLIFPLGAVGVAIWAENKSFGLLNQVAWPLTLEAILAVLLLDLAIYGQHVFFHRWPPLWRLHRMHHTDPDFDLSTGNRFHLFEILLSMAFKAALTFRRWASFSSRLC
jgi:sterol desaturase/sphingolipid hydroxylase (fatty acid hydroxylase superfamily)